MSLTFVNLPNEVINYIIYNFLDCNDVKTLLITCKIFNVLNENQLKIIKEKWFKKYCEEINEKIEIDSHWYGSKGYFKYKKIFGNKEGPFIKSLTYVYGCVRKNKIIKGYFKQNKLHGKYEITYNYYISRCHSCGNKKIGTKQELHGFLNFDNGQLLDFEIINNNKKITNKGTLELEKISNQTQDPVLDEILKKYFEAFNNIDPQTIETRDIISLLELDDNTKIQICLKLNEVPIKNVQFLD